MIFTDHIILNIKIFLTINRFSYMNNLDDVDLICGFFISVFESVVGMAFGKSDL